MVAHYGRAGTGTMLPEGTVFTIEPMINQGHWKTKTLADQWTAITIDGKLSVQFEHTLVIVHSGVEVLTSFDWLKDPRKPY